MKKLNSKGFMLTETLIASTLLITVLLIMYIQFKNVLRNYQQSFSYNTVNDLYNLYNVKKYIEQENYVSMAGRLDINKYVDIKSCNSIYYSNPSYCEQLYSNLNIEELYLTKENVDTLKSKNDLGKDINEFLKTIKSSTGSGYRIVAKFYGNTYATLRVFTGSNYKAQISQSCNTANKIKYTIYHKNQSTNEDIKEADVNEASCGSSVSLTGYIDTNNSCLYKSGSSVENLDITQDETTNIATIYYKKYESTLTLRYLEQGTNNVVSTAKILTVNCGDVVNIDDYIIKIDNREFIKSSTSQVNVDASNKTVDLIYTIEGGTVHE